MEIEIESKCRKVVIFEFHLGICGQWHTGKRPRVGHTIVSLDNWRSWRETTVVVKFFETSSFILLHLILLLPTVIEPTPCRN